MAGKNQKKKKNMARKVPSFCLQLSKPFAFSSTLSLLKKKPFLSVGLIREYHGLKFLRPVQGTPSHISAEDPEPTGPPQPMTFEQFKREYEDVLSVFRFRPGMTNVKFLLPFSFILFFFQ